MSNSNHTGGLLNSLSQNQASAWAYAEVQRQLASAQMDMSRRLSNNPTMIPPPDGPADEDVLLLLDE